MQAVSRFLDRPPPASLDFRAIFELVPTQLMVMDRNLKIVYANPAYLATTLRTLDEIQGRYVFEAFPEAPERVERFRSAFLRALEGEANALRMEPFEIPVPGQEGQTRFTVWTCTHTPIPDETGKIAYVLQNAVDVTAEFELDRRNQELMRELGHRMKNTLATVQAVAQMSLVANEDPQQARENFAARLRAMARTQSLLLYENWSGTELEPLLADLLTPFGYERGNSGSIRFEGPAVPLSPRQAQALSMGVYELATNAAKYGALSVPSGTIDIAWEFDAASRRFALTWTEAGGPPVSQPTRQGFGTKMLRDITAREVGGTTTIEFRASGLVCRIEGTLP